jgi:p-aminobenzoyl-glutamate transporter AbgT
MKKSRKDNLVFVLVLALPGLATTLLALLIAWAIPAAHWAIVVPVLTPMAILVAMAFTPDDFDVE